MRSINCKVKTETTANSDYELYKNEMKRLSRKLNNLDTSSLVLIINSSNDSYLDLIHFHY